MRPLLVSFVVACAVAAEEPPFIREEITDASRLSPEERKERAFSCLQVLEKWPEGDAARASVGPLLMFRAELRGDLADRAGRALGRVTGEDFGTDFEKWQEWFDGVKTTERWSPMKIYLTKRNPKYVLEGPKIILAWSSDAPKALDKCTRLLKAPCALRCASLDLYVRAETDLQVRWDPNGSQLSLKSHSEFIISGPAGARSGFFRTKEIALDLFHLAGVEYFSGTDLRNVPQQVADARIDDTDPTLVMQYVCEEAQAGNFLPLQRVFGERTLRKLADPEKRKELGIKLGLPEGEGAKLTPEELSLAWMRHDYTDSFLFLGVNTRPDEDDGSVHYNIDHFGGSSGGSLFKREGKWRGRN